MVLFLIDANILIFSANPAAVEHQECVKATDAIRLNGDIACVIPQSLYEFWVVATRPMAERGLGMTPAQAQAELITIKGLFPTFPDNDAIYPEWERLVIQHSVSGKNAHDARYVAAMNVHWITNFLTYNKRHFTRFGGINPLLPSEI